jgi:N-acetylglucosamine kinase-like BadF-type ATPase
VSWALAVDGGNTKTLALVAGPDGLARGAGRGGIGDIYGAPTPEHALDAIQAAAEAALAEAGVGPADLGAAAFSLAGADWPEDFTLLRSSLRERLQLPFDPLVVNDSLGALRAGSPDWTGMAIVAGTYNAIGARGPDGRAFHLGFWPDGAGGRDIAREGLRAVYRAEMNLGPRTGLTARALELFGAADPIDLLHEFTRRGGHPEAVGDRFAPLVLDAADDGDEVARAIVAEKGRILGAQGRSSAERIGLPLEGARAVLTGGVFDHPTSLLADATMAELPGAVVVRGGPPPVAGALLLALDGIGVRIDEPALAASLPSTSMQGRSGAWAPSPSNA